MAFFKLPVSPLPQVDFPTISVRATLPGASPQDVATTVASPLERHLGQIADVTEMTSVSTVGSTRITLQFGLNRDIDGAARDVQAAINAARADLPTSLRSNPTYRKVNPADAPILILTLTSDTLTPRPALRRRLDRAGAEAVAGRRHRRGRVSGSSLPAVRVELNPQALFKYGIGLEDVRAALASANAQQPQGRASKTATSATRSTPTTRPTRPTITSRWSSPTATAPPVQLSDVGRSHRFASKTCATPASPTASRRC